MKSYQDIIVRQARYVWHQRHNGGMWAQPTGVDEIAYIFEKLPGQVVIDIMNKLNQFENDYAKYKRIP